LLVRNIILQPLSHADACQLPLHRGAETSFEPPSEEGGGGEADGGSENYSIRDEVTPYRSTGTYRAAGISQAKPISLCRKANNPPHLFKKSILHSPLLVL